jgi:cobalt-precorrin 5A hydrolase
MKLAVIAITRGGKELAERLVQLVDDLTLITGKTKVAEKFADNWHNFDGFICIMAAGIAVRSIAPLLSHKHHDPCIVVMDEKGQHIISLLSGHIGGGNDLTRKIATLTGGRPVITTASDTLNLVALDLWARDQNLVIENQDDLTKATTRLVNQGFLKLYSDIEVASLPKGLKQVQDFKEADIIVSHFKTFPKGSIHFRPSNLVIGTGCNRGTPVEEFESAMEELLNDLYLNSASIRNLASIDKKNDEVGLLQFAVNNGWNIEFFNKKSINTLNNIEISFAALKAVGAIGVAEPTALLSAQSNLLLSRKRKWKNVTMAIAQVPYMLSEQARDQ